MHPSVHLLTLNFILKNRALDSAPEGLFVMGKSGVSGSSTLLKAFDDFRVILGTSHHQMCFVQLL
jgi:hypothetical protein